MESQRVRKKKENCDTPDIIPAHVISKVLKAAR